MEESRVDRAKRFSKIWWQSRSDAGKSQEFMALGLGVSKKTIQNWERGISSPSLFQGTEWFRVLGLNPLRYYLSFIFPEMFETDDSSLDDRVEPALIALIQQMSPKEQQELLYLIAGPHGSSWYSLLQLFTAHCHTSMRSRVAAARLILENYEMEEQMNQLVCLDSVMPDTTILTDSIQLGKQAAQHNEAGYSVSKI